MNKIITLSVITASFLQASVWGSLTKQEKTAYNKLSKDCKLKADKLGDERDLKGVLDVIYNCDEDSKKESHENKELQKESTKESTKSHFTNKPYGTPIKKEIDASTLMIGFNGTEVLDSFCSDIKTYNLGAVILFGKNIQSSKQLSKLTNDLQNCSVDGKLLIAVDQEGGKVQRLNPKNGFNGYDKSALEMGAMNDTQINTYYSDMSKELKVNGVKWNLAPVADKDVNGNPIISKYQRAFSDDVNKIADVASIFIKVHNDNNVLTSLKHFPGHGSSLDDSHKGFTDITKTWNEDELIPFKKLKDSLDSIMVGHLFNSNIDGKYPSSLSYDTIQGLLRDKIGYNGVLISDDMQMKAITNNYTTKESIVLALGAGNDMLIFGNQLSNNPMTIKKYINIVNKAINDEYLVKENLEYSKERIQNMKSYIKW